MCTTAPSTRSFSQSRRKRVQVAAQEQRRGHYAERDRGDRRDDNDRYDNGRDEEPRQPAGALIGRAIDDGVECR